MDELYAWYEPHINYNFPDSDHCYSCTACDTTYVQVECGGEKVISSGYNNLDKACPTDLLEFRTR